MSPEALHTSVEDDTCAPVSAHLEDAPFRAVLKTSGSFLAYLTDPDGTLAPEAHLEPMNTRSPEEPL